MVWKRCEAMTDQDLQWLIDHASSAGWRSVAQITLANRQEAA